MSNSSHWSEGGSLHSPLHISHSLPAGTGTPHLHTHRPCNRLRRSSNPLPGNCHRFRLRTRRDRHHNPADRIRMSRLHHRFRLHRRVGMPRNPLHRNCRFRPVLCTLSPHATHSPQSPGQVSQVSSPLQKKSPHSGGQTGQSAGQLWQVSSGSQFRRHTPCRRRSLQRSSRSFHPRCTPRPRTHPGRCRNPGHRSRTSPHPGCNCRPRTQRCSPRSLRDSCSRPPYRCMSHLHTAERTGNHWAGFAGFISVAEEVSAERLARGTIIGAVLTILIGIAGSISTERRTISAIGRTALAVLDAFIAHRFHSRTTIGFACSARFTEVTLPVAAAISTISGACFAGFGRMRSFPQHAPQSCSQEKQLSLASHVPLPQHEPQSSAQLAQSSPKLQVPSPQQFPQSSGQESHDSPASHWPSPQVGAHGPQSAGQRTKFLHPRRCHFRTPPDTPRSPPRMWSRFHSLRTSHCRTPVDKFRNRPGTWSMFRLPCIPNHHTRPDKLHNPRRRFHRSHSPCTRSLHRHRGILRSPPRTIRRFPLPRTGRHHTLEGRSHSPSDRYRIPRSRRTPNLRTQSDTFHSLRHRLSSFPFLHRRISAKVGLTGIGAA